MGKDLTLFIVRKELHREHQPHGLNRPAKRAECGGARRKPALAAKRITGAREAGIITPLQDARSTQLNAGNFDAPHAPFCRLILEICYPEDSSLPKKTDSKRQECVTPLNSTLMQSLSLTYLFSTLTILKVFLL
jgi:hypothetical protein